MALNYSIANMKDFDQKWDILPNNGNMYCVPTSCVNMMSFLSDRGHPKLWRTLPKFMPGHTPRYSSQNIWNNIAIMADYMDTDEDDGTGNSDALDGIEDFVSGRYFGAWYSRACSNDDMIRISNLENHFSLPRIGVVCFGRYKSLGSNNYDRQGGHCITVTGLKVSGSNATLLYHDPARSNDDNLNTQSSILEHSLPISNKNIKMDGDWRYGIKMETSGNLRMIDSYIIMAPFFLLDYSDINKTISYSQELNANNAIKIDTRTLDVSKIIGSVQSLVTDAEQTTAFVTSKDKKGVWKIPLGTMVPELVTEELQPQHIAVGPDGASLFMAVDKRILSLEPGKKPVRVTELDEAPAALNFDIKGKQLIAATPQSGVLYAIDKTKTISKIAVPKIDDTEVKIGFDHTGEKLFMYSPRTRSLQLTPLKKGTLAIVTENRFAGKKQLTSIRPFGKDNFIAVENSKLKIIDAGGNAVKTQWNNFTISDKYIAPQPVNSLRRVTDKKWKN